MRILKENYVYNKIDPAPHRSRRRVCWRINCVGRCRREDCPDWIFIEKAKLGFVHNRFTPVANSCRTQISRDITKHKMFFQSPCVLHVSNFPEPESVLAPTTAYLFLSYKSNVRTFDAHKKCEARRSGVHCITAIHNFTYGRFPCAGATGNNDKRHPTPNQGNISKIYRSRTKVEQSRSCLTCSSVFSHMK